MKKPNKQELIMKPGYKSEKFNEMTTKFRLIADLPCEHRLKKLWQQGTKGVCVLSASTLSKAGVHSNGQYIPCLDGTSRRTVEISEAHPNESKRRLWIPSLLHRGGQPLSFVFSRNSKASRGVGKLSRGRRDNFRCALIGHTVGGLNWSEMSYGIG